MDIVAWWIICNKEGLVDCLLILLNLEKITNGLCVTDLKYLEFLHWKTKMVFLTRSGDLSH